MRQADSMECLIAWGQALKQLKAVSRGGLLNKDGLHYQGGRQDKTQSSGKEADMTQAFKVNLPR